MTRDFQPKVTSIKEPHNLNILGITTLFGKLKEHQHEIIRFKFGEEDVNEKEKNSILLNASSSKENTCF